VLIRMNKAQSTLEYALLIGVVVGALLYMQNYLKRSLQGRLQTVGDEMGEQYSPGNTHRIETAHIEQGSITETITGGEGIDPQTGGNTTTEVLGGSEVRGSTKDLKTLDVERWHARRAGAN